MSALLRTSHIVNLPISGGNLSPENRHKRRQQLNWKTRFCYVIPPPLSHKIIWMNLLSKIYLHHHLEVGSTDFWSLSIFDQKLAGESITEYLSWDDKSAIAWFGFVGNQNFSLWMNHVAKELTPNKSHLTSESPKLPLPLNIFDSLLVFCLFVILCKSNVWKVSSLKSHHSGEYRAAGQLKNVSKHGRRQWSFQ